MGWWVHSSLNALNATKLYALTWLKWHISCHVPYNKKNSDNEGVGGFRDVK